MMAPAAAARAPHDAALTRDWIIAGVSMIATAWLLAQLLDYGYGRDQGIYATAARAIREGGVPYRDAWDFKPPAIFFVYALADLIAGPGVRAIRWLEAASVLTLVPACVLLARRYVGSARAGYLCAALATLIYVQAEFWDTAQPESFGCACVVWGIVCAGAAMDRRAEERRDRVLLWTLAGALYAAAALLKPTIGIAGGWSLALGVYDVQQRPGRGSVISVVAAFGAGALVACTVVLAPFLIRGGLRDLWDAVFVFAPRYTAVSWQGGWSVAARVLFDWAWGYSIVNAVGLLLLVLPPHAPDERRGLTHVLPMIALLLLGVALQAKLFLYHYGTVLPLTAIVAGWGYWKLWTRLRAHAYGAAVLVALVGVLAFGRDRAVPTFDPFFARCQLRLYAWRHPDARTAIRDRLYSLYDYSARDNRLVSEWIAAQTPQASTLFVWGFTPELYVATGRRTIGRYIYDVPQRSPWTRDTARGALLRDLAASPPATFVVERFDAVPQVTGTLNDSAADLRAFDELQRFLDRHYRLAYRVTKFDVYRRVA